MIKNEIYVYLYSVHDFVVASRRALICARSCMTAGVCVFFFLFHVCALPLSLYVLQLQASKCPQTTPPRAWPPALLSRYVCTCIVALTWALRARGMEVRGVLT